MTAPVQPGTADLAEFVQRAHHRGLLAVQPRMGMSDPAVMAAGLRAVAKLPVAAVGTITLDSYTRLGDHRAACQAVVNREQLNGFPIVAHGVDVTLGVLEGLGSLPVQVRHGSPDPRAIFATMAQIGLSASEGGPVSYCLPYGRTPLATSVQHWREATEQFADDTARAGRRAHLETFGGCLLGQLCPPALLVAMSVLEAMFFVQAGITSVSLSYAQQINPTQDIEALVALRVLAQRFLPAHIHRHLVVYTYMGVFPHSAIGAGRLLQNSAQIAVLGGAERLIVKTTVEANRIPTVPENLTALVTADRAATVPPGDWPTAAQVDYSAVLRDAERLITATCELSDDLGMALLHAFSAGVLDVPFCLHPDNHGRSSSYVCSDGRLQWASIGRMPLTPVNASAPAVSSDRLLKMLRFNADRFDHLSPPLNTEEPSAGGQGGRHAQL